MKNLDVELKFYFNGKRTLDEGLFANQTDVISSTQLPIALAVSFHPISEPLRAIAPERVSLIP